MDSAVRGRLRELTLTARRLLTTEVREMLQGVYGLSPDGRFEPAERLPAVREIEEVGETRVLLERFLADEAAVGLHGAEAVDKLVKEVAFTHLNRLVAFKMLEARSLIRGTLDRYHESNAFKFYLAEPEHAEDYEHFLSGDLPKDSLGEGPRETAYRHFLLDQCARMSREIRVLFDPDDLASRLFPRPRALRDLVDMLNAPEVAAAWAQGNEETIGWVYQYFNEPDLEAYRGARAPKVPTHLIAPRTQLFTPRWIVRQLVHNSLGRTWVEMHPDSRLKDSLDYLVPLADDVPQPPLKLAREITVLDPACGTMHFGLVAFDVLAEMYREELENAGEPGWPEKPSVMNEAEIPAAILHHNLYGIDIDLRAVQLSALTLYLKAKSFNPDAAITESNLACADVRLPDGERLDDFVREAGFEQPVYERLVRAAWKRLGNLAVAGSLVRVEEEIGDLVRQERERYEREGRQPDFFGGGDEYEAEAAEEGFWDALRDRILEAFDAYARRQAEEGHDESYFVGEATKGLRVLDVMLRRYDIVVTNPPYLDSRDYNIEIKKIVNTFDMSGKRNLYAAFILRCIEMLSTDGRLGIVTPQTFMFISSFEMLRNAIQEEMAIETLLHTGLNTFPDAVVDVSFYVLRQETRPAHRNNAVGTYFRLVREPNARAKRLGFERALARMRSEEDDAAVFRYRQGDLKSIPGAPWVYWITLGLRRLFKILPKLKDVAPPKHGMSTGSNFRFLRFWWEVGNGRTARGCTDAWKAQETGQRWFPYMKGGGYRRWYGNQANVVNYYLTGTELLAAKEDGTSPGHRHDNPNFYFRRGVTYSYLTSGTFNARISPGGFIFDVAGSSLFPKDVPLVLAVMNSTFAFYALRLINPTVNFQVGDLARLPIPENSSDTLQHLVGEAIELAKAHSTEDETTYDFIAPPRWKTGPDEVRRRKARLAEIEVGIDEEVYRLYDISDDDRAAIESELAEPVEEDGDGAPEREDETIEAPGREELAQRWISYAVGVVLGRFSPGEENVLGRSYFSEDIASRLRSLADPDGVTTLDEGHPDDLAAKVEAALDLMVGEDETVRLLDAAGVDTRSVGDGLRRYLERDFFKQHVRLYRKRPVYWLLQSPGKSYGVYAFHERITRDTLYLISGNRYLGGKINGVRAMTSELSERMSALPEGQEKKRLAKELDSQEELLADLEAFRWELAAVTSHQNSRGEVVGWEPELDDGVLLNLAPSHTLMPSWSAEPRKAWEALAAGSYDWSHTAMRYWPDRVIEASRNNKSFAIAHGLEEAYAGGN
jgi:hypothetical protein